MASALAGGGVARNYADTLLALASKTGDEVAWGGTLRQLATAIADNLTLQRFLGSPRIAADRKSRLLSRALGDGAPPLLLRFLSAVVRNRRQTLIPAIADEYDTLLDATHGVVHARVTVARDASAAEVDVMAAHLTKAIGRTVVPHVTIDPAILGGVVVRLGDTVMDGSVRRKLGILRRSMGTHR